MLFERVSCVSLSNKLAPRTKNGTDSPPTFYCDIGGWFKRPVTANLTWAQRKETGWLATFIFPSLLPHTTDVNFRLSVFWFRSRLGSFVGHVDASEGAARMRPTQLTWTLVWSRGEDDRCRVASCVPLSRRFHFVAATLHQLAFSPWQRRRRRGWVMQKLSDFCGWHAIMSNVYWYFGNLR